MKNYLRRTFGVLGISLLLACGGPSAVESSNGTAQGTAPKDLTAVPPFQKEGGRPFRLGVVMSGDYYFYNNVLISILQGLAELGWSENVPLNEEVRASIPAILSAWSAGSRSTYIQLDPGLFVDLNWTEDPQPPEALKTLLSGASGADLVISLGTSAGTFVRKIADQGGLKVPVMVESVSDPIGSGIITGKDDSGHPLITASFDPDAYDRQIRLFHRLAGFSRLGLIYADTDDGRAYSALGTVQKAAEDLGFTILARTDVLEDPSDPADLPLVEAAYLKAFGELAPQVDAIYLTIQAGLTDKTLPRVVQLAEKYRLPLFVMEGENFVWKGALLGEANNVVTIEGLYSAQKLTRILKGAPPREQPQVNPHLSHIAVNLETARRIGFDVPLDVLLSADDVFTEILNSGPADGAGEAQ